MGRGGDCSKQGLLFHCLKESTAINSSRGCQVGLWAQCYKTLLCLQEKAETCVAFFSKNLAVFKIKLFVVERVVD